MAAGFSRQAAVIGRILRDDRQTDMLTLLGRTLRQPATLRRQITGIYALLILANLSVWAWAVLVFGNQPVLLGAALLAYGFGLRHAVDADHIAAIDNATRKLMQEGKRPVGAGLFFAMGHSSVVIVAAAGVAGSATALAGSFDRFKAVGSIIGTSVSMPPIRTATTTDTKVIVRL